MSKIDAMENYDKLSTKDRFMCVLKILLEYSDESHPMDRSDILEKLHSDYNATADVKSISDDLKTISDFGYDLIQNEDKKWFIGKQKFDLSELKILVDAVQSAKFITKNQSKVLIEKLGSFCSKHDRAGLVRDVLLTDRIKGQNKSLLYDLDTIYDALRDRKMISYQYCEWNIAKELVPRHDGKVYETTPVAVVWDDENYYLIARERGEEINKTFRVDKLKSVNILDEKGDSIDSSKYCKGTYSKSAFGMYGGTDEKVTLVGDNSIVGVIIDRFGKDFLIVPEDENHFSCDVNVVVSPQFYGWLAGLGDKIWIKNPQSVIDEYQTHLETILGKYQK